LIIAALVFLMLKVTVSIDAARLIVNICHTSAEIKTTDPECFYIDGDWLHDMQSQNKIFP